MGTVETSAALFSTALVAVVFLDRAIGDFRYVGFKQVRGSRFARLDTILFSPLQVIVFLSTTE